MSSQTVDPWGRQPHETNDEDLSDLYGNKEKSSNRPPSATSVDRWGQNDDEVEEIPKQQNDAKSYVPSTTPAEKPPSRPTSRQTEPLPDASDTFAHNQKPDSRTSSPVVPNDKTSQSPKPGSRPPTSDGVQKRESRSNTPVSDKNGPPTPTPSSPIPEPDSNNSNSDAGPAVPQNDRVNSKPTTPDNSRSKSASPVPSKPSSPITNGSRPPSVMEDGKKTPTPTPDAGRASPQQVEKRSPPTKSPVTSRPGSKMEQNPSPQPPPPPPSNNNQLKSDSKRVRNENLVLPKPVNNDDIRRKAFDNMKNKKAHPSYLFTHFPRVVEAIMRYLPYKSLCKSQSVCRAWYKAGRYEKQRRNFIDSDCYKVELTRDHVPDDQDDDLQIELYKIMDEMFVQPTTILAFMTWRTVTMLPDILFRILPLNCSTICVSSEPGIVGTRKNGKVRIYADAVHESCSVLLVPKIDQFQIYQFSSSRPDQLKLSDRFFDSIGTKKYEDKKHIKCFLIFVSGGKNRNSNDVTQSLLDRWNKEIENSIQSRSLLIGANVNFCQHGVKKILGKEPKLYSTENDVNGLAFQGENFEVFSLVLKQVNENSLTEEFEKVKLFVGRSASNTFAILLNGLNEDDEKMTLKHFKTTLPNTRIVGLRINGILFGQNFNSYDDRKSSKKQNIVVGRCLILTIFKVSKSTTAGRSNGDKTASTTNDGKNSNILKGSKVKM